MKKFFSLLTWNHYLAVFISAICLSFFFATDIGEKNYFIAALSISVIGFITFGLFGQFYTFVGALIKVFSLLAVAALVLYLTRDLLDEHFLFIIRVVVSVITLIAVISYAIFFYIKVRRENLIKNGWLLETRLEEIIRESSDNFQQYILKSTASHPVSGETMRFKSQAVSQTVADELMLGDVIRVYLDKKNPKRYHLDMSDFIDEKVFF
jgi:hypothetical protein